MSDGLMEEFELDTTDDSVFTQISSKELSLREYQVLSVDHLRAGIRNGHRCQVLCSPTGSGKTIVAVHLIKEAQGKNRRVAFIVDRISLCEQTSAVLSEYGIRHGVAQGQNTFGRMENIQVCSAQTIEKRDYLADVDLLLIDECQTQRDKILEYCKNLNVPVIGLTATPFSSGMGKLYTNVVNVTTTDKLIADGYLVAPIVYIAEQIDMVGAATQGGEWTGREIEQRGKVIIGDIVSNWVDKTKKHYGGPVKTLVFSATVDHGNELCRQFQADGYNFVQISYKDDNDKCSAIIEEFRRPNSAITGLISCEKLVKGLDVPSVQCLISARPYRKSFTSHIQQIGRGMRTSPGKNDWLLLDHSGNYVGFYDRMLEFFANGVDKLDDGERDKTPRTESTKEKVDYACSSCGYAPMAASLEFCPSCGKQKAKRNTVETVPGNVVEFDATNGVKKKHAYLRDPNLVWKELCVIGLERKKGNKEAALSFAEWQYSTFYQRRPRGRALETTEWVDPRLRSHVKANIIRYVHSKKNGRRRGTI